MSEVDQVERWRPLEEPTAYIQKSKVVPALRNYMTTASLYAYLLS